MYLGTEWHVKFDHLPTHVSCVEVANLINLAYNIMLLQDWSWPPVFDSYLKVKYFWLIFVGCNAVWIVIPLYIYISTFKEMSKLLHKVKQS